MTIPYSPALSCAHAANDDGRSHDLASFLDHLRSLSHLPVRSLSHLPVRNLAWLSQQLEGHAFTRMTVGELITLIDRARTLPHAQPHAQQGGAQ